MLKYTLTRDGDGIVYPNRELVYLTVDHIDEMNNQAERIKELEGERTLNNIREHRDSEVQKLIDDNKSLTQRLEKLTKCSYSFHLQSLICEVGVPCQGCKNKSTLESGGVMSET